MGAEGGFGVSAHRGLGIAVAIEVSRTERLAISDRVRKVRLFRSPSILGWLIPVPKTSTGRTSVRVEEQVRASVPVDVSGDHPQGVGVVPKAFLEHRALELEAATIEESADVV